LPHRAFKWLQPPASNRWFGIFNGDKRAEVWSLGTEGKIALWCWSVPDYGIAGAISGTGNDDADRYSAQILASHAFLDAHHAANETDYLDA